jgi:hypothetical protein
MDSANCITAALLAAAGEDHPVYAGIARALNNLIAIVVETVVRQVRTYVNQIDGHSED